jgi:hypothetical protein
VVAVDGVGVVGEEVVESVEVGAVDGVLLDGVLLGRSERGPFLLPKLPFALAGSPNGPKDV